MESLPTNTRAEDIVAERVPPRGLRALFHNLWSTAKVFIVSLAIVIPIRAYVAQPFFVRGESMAPSFHDGEYLIIEELSYRAGLRPIQRGDVVVFRYPLNPTQYYIKRVIGLPGETLRLGGGGAVTIASKEFPRGVILDESTYLPATELTEGTLALTLKKDEVAVLGDNRDHSSDSRSWGPLPADLIIGRAWVRAFPVTRAGKVATPWYGFLTRAGTATGAL